MRSRPDMARRLIVVTLCAYAATQLWRLVGLLMQWAGRDWQPWLALHSNLNDLALTPWTPLTYMFCHADIGTDAFHIVGNMLWLWWFGERYQSRQTGGALLALYLSGGLVAGGTFVACYNAFPYFLIERHYATLVGASGAVCALIAATAVGQAYETVCIPLGRLTFRVRLMWVAVAVVALTAWGSGPGDGGTLCHVGGLAWGLGWGLAERRGLRPEAPARRLAGALRRIVEPQRRPSRTDYDAPMMKASPGGRAIDLGRRRDMAYNAGRRAQGEQIDAILDKIGQHGYDSLTDDERKALFDASQRRREQQP